MKAPLFKRLTNDHSETRHLLILIHLLTFLIWVIISDDQRWLVDVFRLALQRLWWPSRLLASHCSFIIFSTYRMVFHHKFFRILDVGEYRMRVPFLKNCLTILSRGEQSFAEKKIWENGHNSHIYNLYVYCKYLYYSLYIMNKTQVCNIH